MPLDPETQRYIDALDRRDLLMGLLPGALLFLLVTVFIFTR